MKRIIYIVSVLALFGLASCAKDNEAQEAFVDNFTNVGLSIAGESVFSYAENKCQLGYSADYLEFRVSDDTMNNFYALTLRKMPEGIGSSVRGDLIWTTSTDVRQRGGLDFKLIRAEGDYMWLWNKKNDIGVVVRKIEL